MTAARWFYGQPGFHGRIASQPAAALSRDLAAARLEYERDTEDPHDRDPLCEQPGAPGYPHVEGPAQ